MDKNNKNNKFNIFRFLLRSVLFLITSLLTLSVVIILLAQTEAFRKWAAQEISNIANNALEAEVSFEDIMLHRPQGIEFFNINMIAASDTLLNAKYLALDINYPELLQGDVRINSITIEEPKIKLLRSLQDSTWNFEHIAKASEEESTESSGSTDLRIYLDRFSISDADFVVWDSCSAELAQDRIDFSHLNVDNFNLSMDAQANLLDSEFKARIKELSFHEKRSDLNLKNLSFAALINSDRAVLANFDFKSENSQINLDASIQNINLLSSFTNDDLAISTVILDINIEHLYKRDFNLFLGESFSLGKDISLNLRCEGVLNDMIVKDLELYSEGTEISMNAGVRNVLNSQDIQYYAHIRSLSANTTKVNDLLADIDLSSVPQNIDIDIINSDFSGDLSSAKGEYIIKTSAGDISGTSSVNFAKEITVKSDMQFEKLNINPILNSEGLLTRLNGTVKAELKGTDLKSMIANTDLNLSNSTFNNIIIDSLNLNCNIADNRANINALKINFDYEKGKRISYIENQASYLSLNGAISDIESKFIYELKLNANSLDLALLLDDHSLPRSLSSKFKLKGAGLDPEKLRTDISISIEECQFEDKYLMPFYVDMQVAKEGNNREISLNSDFVDLKLNGDYKIENLISNSIKFSELINYDVSKITGIISKQDSIFQLDSIDFNKANINIDLNVKEFSLINSLIDQIDMNTTFEMKANLDFDTNKVDLNISKLDLQSFTLNQKDQYISLTPFQMESQINYTYKDSSIISDLILKSANKFNLRIDDLKLNDLLFDVEYNGDNIEYDISAEYDELVAASLNGIAKLSDKNILIKLNNLKVDFDSLSWSNNDLLEIDYSGEKIIFNNFALIRSDNERLSIDGIFEYDKFSNLKLSINNLGLDFINEFVQNEYLSRAKGNIKDLSITLNNTFENPKIKTDISISDLYFDDYLLGKTNIQSSYKNQNLKAKVDIAESKDLPAKISLDLLSMPINLSFTPVNERLNSEKDIHAKININDFELETVSNLVPAISGLKGNSNAVLDIKARYPEDLSVNGQVNYTKTSFVLDATNIKYFSEGEVQFNGSEIFLKEIELKNDPKDNRRGQAKAFGNINLEKFEIADLDLKFIAKQFTVITPATKKSMPGLYGDFQLSTGERPLRFYGNLTKPNLSGDVDILSANLIMPEERIKTSAKSYFKYVVKNGKVNIIDTNKRTTGLRIVDSLSSLAQKMNNDEEKKEKTEVDFADIINYDIGIRFIGRFFVTMELPALSQLSAEIGTENPDQIIRYVKDRNKSAAQLYGDIIIKQGSKLKMYKPFDAVGKITFPTGDIDNPGLNIEAHYEVTSYIDNESKNYDVQLLLTGSKKNLNVQFSYSLNGQEVYGSKEDITKDCVLLLLTGKTSEDLAGNHEGVGSFSGELANNITNSSASHLSSYALTEILSTTGVIQNADFQLGEDGDFANARLKLSGQIQGLRWEIGGTVTDLVTSNEFVIDAPLDTFFDIPFLNANITVTVSVNPTVTPNLDQKLWEFKLKFGGSN